MDAKFQEEYISGENSFWWCRGRRDLLLSFLRGVPKNARILEIGCSGGEFLGELEQAGYNKVYGVDISKQAAEKAAGKKLRVFCCDAVSLPFEEGFFDFIIASDVLEHIKEDEKALLEWRRVLKPGGIGVITVPAFQFLYSCHDVTNEHYRRYSKSAFIGVSGRFFSCVRFTYWNFFAFFPRALGILLRRLLSHEKPPSFRINPLLNEIFYQVVRVENSLIAAGFNLPVGLSCVAVVKK